jgi:polysaccharide export outer membrane protein
MKRLLVYLTLLLGVSSCVTNKKFQLMQKNDVHHEQVKDSVLRTYTIDTYDYKLQPFDVLTVRFESLTPTEFDFLNKQGSTSGMVNPAAMGYFGEMISPAGEIQFPVIGGVSVAGLTLFEAQDKLQDLANEYLDSPKVVCRLVNFRISLLGEVAREGQVVLINTRVSMLEAIAMGGGLGEFADRSNVKLIRQSGSKIDIQYINLLDENFINSPYFYVHQNDVLIVPPLRQKPFRRYFGPNLALVSSSLAFFFLAYNIFNGN